MRIAYFSDTFYPQINGIVTSIINSSRILAKRGHKIIIFTAKPKETRNTRQYRQITLHKNITLIRYRSINAFKYPGYELVIPQTAQCLKKLMEFKPDLIHIHTPTPLGWIGIMAGKLYSIPVVGTYHTIVPDFLKHSPFPKISRSKFAKKMAWKYTNNFYGKCNIVTTPSAAMKRELIKNKLNSKIEVVSNGVDVNLFYQTKRENHKFRILYVGRVSYEKSIDVVLKAVSLFSKKCSDFEFWIVGSGPEIKKIKRLIAGLKIESHTKIIGAVDNSRLPEIYSNSDVFVTASTIETEGITLLEAMACGLPIIGVNARAVPDVVKDKINGFVVEVGDYRDMAGKIQELYAGSGLRKKIMAENIKTAQRYDVKGCVSKMESIYSKLAPLGFSGYGVHH